MKKALVGIGMFISAWASAQCTIDYSKTEPGVYPTLAEGFADAYVNTSYTQYVQVRVLTDTLIDLATVGLGTGTQQATIFYATIDSVEGLPSGFSYECNPSSCQINAGDNGCVTLSGTPTIAQENQTYNLNIHITLYGLPDNLIGLVSTPFPFSTVVTGYSVEVRPQIESTNNTHVFPAKTYPNPTADVANVDVFLGESQDLKINIVNVLGETVRTTNGHYDAGLNTLHFSKSDLGSGIFFVQIEGATGSSVQRIIIK